MPRATSSESTVTETTLYCQVEKGQHVATGPMDVLDQPHLGLAAGQAIERFQPGEEKRVAVRRPSAV